MVSACQFDNTTTKTLSDSLLLLSAQILMAIEAGNHGQSGARGAGSQAIWLGAAVGHAFSLKLHTSHAAEGEDDDSIEKLSRRIWWSLIVLDRFHASGTSSPLLIPDTSAVLRLDDIGVLGEQLYHLARKFLHHPHSLLLINQTRPLLDPRPRRHGPHRAPLPPRLPILRHPSPLHSSHRRT